MSRHVLHAQILKVIDAHLLCRRKSNCHTYDHSHDVFALSAKYSQNKFHLKLFYLVILMFIYYNYSNG